ncbi:MAG: tRNA (adenosine(37)-N6)-dimethylallyltransferase MiaA [Parvularculales bacterium]
MPKLNIPLILITGPTACGKSALALKLASAFNGAIINADSMQVYRELRILTARPTPEQETQVPHHLYGMIPALQRFSVAAWLEVVRRTINEVAALGQLPIVVGGTGLYMTSLVRGLDAMPDIPDVIRREVRDSMARGRVEVAYEQLRAIDPFAAARVHPHDTQRIARALEVFRATGKSLTEWWQESQSLSLALPKGWIGLVLTSSRGWLHDRGARRVERMIAAGAVEEVATLAALGLDPALPAMKALGVKPLMALLQGNISKNEALEAIKTATRRYGKRQGTWIKQNMISWQTINSEQLENDIDIIFSIISKKLLTLT